MCLECGTDRRRVVPQTGPDFVLCRAVHRLRCRALKPGAVVRIASQRVVPVTGQGRSWPRLPGPRVAVQRRCRRTARQAALVHRGSAFSGLLFDVERADGPCGQAGSTAPGGRPRLRRVALRTAQPLPLQDGLQFLGRQKLLVAMQHVVAVRADRAEVFRRINPLRTFDLRQRRQVMDVDETLAKCPVDIPKLKPQTAQDAPWISMHALRAAGFLSWRVVNAGNSFPSM